MIASELNSKIKNVAGKLNADEVVDMLTAGVDDRLVRAALISRYEELCGDDAADELLDRMGL